MLNVNTFIRNFFTLAIVIIIWSCSSKDLVRKYPPCISEPTSKINIKWGDYAQRRNECIDCYGVNTNAEIFKMDDYRDSLKIKIGVLPDSTFCRLYFTLLREIIKTQTVTGISDTLRFIQFNDPNVNSNTRVFWNPLFKFEANANFREIFKEMNQIVQTYRKD